MKTVMVALVLALCGLAPTAHAWNCSDPLAARVPVATGTAGSFGNGDGQLFLGTGSEGVKGQLYACEVPKPPVTPPPTTTSTSNTNQNSNTNSNSNSNQNTSSSKSTSSSNATGGNSSSTATGGNATANGGSATGGSVSNSGNSSISGSGNSTNRISTTVTAQGGAGGSATQGQKQSQAQSQSLSNVGNASAQGGSANGSGNSSNSYVNNDPRQTPPAVAPFVAPTVPCFKGTSVAGSTGMFGFAVGGGKIDENCAELEAARVGSAGSKLAFCKVYITNKYVRKAGVTLEDCLGPQPTITVVQGPATVVEEPQQPVITVNVPAPVVTIIPAPIAPPAPDVVKAAVIKKAEAQHVKHHAPCVTNDTIK